MRTAAASWLAGWLLAATAAAAPIEPLPLGAVAYQPGALALSADGRVAAHVDPQGRVLLWDAASYRPLAGTPADIASATAVALSRDGRWLAVGQADGRLQLWSRGEPAQAPRELRGHSGRILSLAFAPDDRTLASGSEDSTTQLFDVADGRRLQVWDSLYVEGPYGDGAWPVALAFAANGRLLAAHDWHQRHYDVGRSTTLWQLSDGMEHSTWGLPGPGFHEARQPGQAVGAGGWLLAVAGPEGVMLERLDGCAPARKLPAVESADTLAADPQGRWVAATAGTQLAFSAVAGMAQSKATLELPAPALSLLVEPDGRSLLALLSGQSDTDAATARLYRIEVPPALQAAPALQVEAKAAHCPLAERARLSQDFKRVSPVHPLPVVARLAPDLAPQTRPGSGQVLALHPVHSLQFGRDGAVLALYHLSQAGGLSAVVTWQVSAQRRTAARVADDVKDPLLAFDGGWIAAGTDQTLRNLVSGKPVLSFSDANDGFRPTLAIDRDTGIVHRVVDGAIERVTAEGRRLPALRPRGAVRALVARNQRLLALEADGKAEMFDRGSSRGRQFPMAGQPEADEAVWGLMLSADGRYLYAIVDSAGSDAPAVETLYRVADGEMVGSGAPLAPLPGHANRSVLPDARPHHLLVWDMDKAEALAHLPRQRSRDADGHVMPLRAALSNDGRRVASASPDGLVRVWDIDAHRLLGEARVGAAVMALAFDPAGRQLAVGRAGGEVWVLALP